jgi:hypothetical protein
VQSFDRGAAGPVVAPDDGGLKPGSPNPIRQNDLRPGHKLSVLFGTSGGLPMAKGRESGMPDETYWREFFNPD